MAGFLFLFLFVLFFFFGGGFVVVFFWGGWFIWLVFVCLFGGFFCEAYFGIERVAGMGRGCARGGTRRSLLEREEWRRGGGGVEETRSKMKGRTT